MYYAGGVTFIAFVRARFGALPGSPSSCVVMFAQRLSKCCEVSFTARGDSASALVAFADAEVTG